MLRFVRADKITDVESAERILSKYRNREVEFKLGPNTFLGNFLDAEGRDGALHVKFTWKNDGTDKALGDIEHVYRLVQSSIGKAVKFQVNTDAFFGLLGSATKWPHGAVSKEYADSPFVLAFAFNEEDQRPIVAASKGSALVLPVPANIQEQLPLDNDLEYDPHITVAYFPDLKIKDVELVLRCAGQAARKTGPISVFLTKSTTFPTPQDDGTYPHVALVKSPELLDFHDEFIDLIERFSPGLADTTFAHKNYTPHVTLSYVPEPNVFTPVKPLAWSVDHLHLSYKGGAEMLPIPLRADMRIAGEEIEPPFLQVGEVRVPVVLLSNDDGELRVRLKRGSQAPLIDDMEGLPAKLVTRKTEQKLEIQEVRESGPDGFQIFYRPLISYMSKGASSKLKYVSAVAEDRGELGVVARIAALLDFGEDDSEEDEAEDKEALGPGFEGTDPHIVTYVKAPQTQQIIEEPKFTRDLPLHERLSEKSDLPPKEWAYAGDDVEGRAKRWLRSNRDSLIKEDKWVARHADDPAFWEWLVRANKNAFPDEPPHHAIPMAIFNISNAQREQGFRLHWDEIDRA